MPSTKKIDMRIPLVDLAPQYRELKEQIQSALTHLMETGNFIKGPAVAAFEKSFADYHGAKHAIGVNSGTDALFLIFKALGVKPGDEIITVPYTFAATAETIIQAGASVKFADIDPERFTLNPAQIESAITPRTVGIVPVHLFGTPADMEPILAIAKKHRLWVVEDACQAHGALYKGKKAGTFGAASAFSFYPSKNLGAYGDGGAVITDDAEIARKIGILRDHGQTSRYHSELPGYNSRLDAFQAAILSIKLPYLDAWNRQRREIAGQYRKILEGLSGVKPPAEFPECEQVYHAFAIRCENRDPLAKHLEKAGIASAIYYVSPLHRQPAYRHAARPMPVSEKLSGEILCLPMYPELSKEQVIYVGETVKSFF